jgi:hypothetical protein
MRVDRNIGRDNIKSQAGDLFSQIALVALKSDNGCIVPFIAEHRRRLAAADRGVGSGNRNLRLCIANERNPVF